MLPNPDCHRNLRKRQAGLVDQLFRKMQPASLGDSNRRSAEMFQEQSAEMSRSDTQPLGELLHAAVIERAFTHQPERSRNGDGRT